MVRHVEGAVVMDDQGRPVMLVKETRAVVRDGHAEYECRVCGRVLMWTLLIPMLIVAVIFMMYVMYKIVSDN